MKHIICFFSILTVLAACSADDEIARGVDNELTDTTSCKIAVMPTLDCLPLFVAEEKGMFDREGLPVVLCEYAAQMDIDTALTQKCVAVAATDVVRAERLKESGVALSYLTTTEASWQLLTGRTARIRQLKQLDDKMLAMARHSATDMLGDMLVDSARLMPERVFRIQINDVNVRLNMLQADIMDALLLPEPQATAARLQKAAVLYDTRRTDMRLGVLVARSDVLSQQQQDALIKVYNLCCDTINRHGLKAFSEVIVRRCNVTRQTVDSLPTDYRFHRAATVREQDVDRAKSWLNKKK